MKDEKRIENTTKQMKIDFNELSKLNSELKELQIEKQAVEENNQKLRDARIERGKQNFAEFIVVAKAMKDFIPVSDKLSEWNYVNVVTVPILSHVFKRDAKFTIHLAKRTDDSIVCMNERHHIYYDENKDLVNESDRPWHLYETFSYSNYISELKTAIKESLEKRIGLTKEQLDKARKEQPWIWKDYDDLSGHLESPDGKSYFEYDWTTKEYKIMSDSGWKSFIVADSIRDTSLSAFKDYAQAYIKDNIANNKDIVFKREYFKLFD